MATQAPPETLTAEAQPGMRPRMTYDEFLAWAGEDTHAEWVSGEVYFLMAAEMLHQQIVDFLQGYDVRVMKTGEAIALYNRLKAEGRRVAIHLRSTS